MLDIDSYAEAGFDEFLVAMISHSISRIDQKTLSDSGLEFKTGIDQFTFNQPFLKSVFPAKNYPLWRDSLFARHRNKSTLIHCYIWAFEVLAGVEKNERELFWQRAIPEIERMKDSFMMLLATGDLTAMHKKERRAMITTFNKYQNDILPWLGYFHTVSWLIAWQLEQKKDRGYHWQNIEAIKKTLHTGRAPILFWHHYKFPDMDDLHKRDSQKP